MSAIFWQLSKSAGEGFKTDEKLVLMQMHATAEQFDVSGGVHVYGPDRVRIRWPGVLTFHDPAEAIEALEAVIAYIKERAQ